jgi:hypothetical protein
MIICEKEFDRPDPKRPEVSAHEVDYYAWVPAGCKINNHRLSLRKNMETGQFEVYRHFYLPTEQLRPVVGREAVITASATQVIFSGSFTGALAFANAELKRVHGVEREDDIACPHLPEKHGFWCPDFRD